MFYNAAQYYQEGYAISRAYSVCLTVQKITRKVVYRDLDQIFCMDSLWDKQNMINFCEWSASYPIAL